jgi:hypothetical protein
MKNLDEIIEHQYEKIRSMLQPDIKVEEMMYEAGKMMGLIRGYIEDKGAEEMPESFAQLDLLKKIYGNSPN